MQLRIQKHLEHAAGYLDLKMYEDARQECDAALALSPDHSQALTLKAAAFWQSDRFQEAEPCLARVAEQHPGDSQVWINLAFIRRRTQSIEAAVETLQRALQVDPQDALAHFNMACYRALQQRPQEAILLLRNALHLDPKLRSSARTEADFASLRALPEFRALLRG
ncbi:tetratricopeptide repeat protein [bacterium]|nr:tetratricopeptide repeat protein [bacterium]